MERDKAILCVGSLPSTTVDALERALRDAGCRFVERVCDIDAVVGFDCTQPGCPPQVAPQLADASLVVLDQEVAGVSGFEVLGVLRGIPETQRAKVIMLGPHGGNDHRTVLAAWSLRVDCYLTRSDFLRGDRVPFEKLGRFAQLLLQKLDQAAA